jgi:hypothetical protein
MPVIEIPGKGNVEFPDTMSQDEIVVAVKKIATPPAPGPLMSSPKGFYGPGVLANLESRLTGKTPQEAYDKRVPQLETASQLLGAAVAPGTGALRQAGGQALMGSGLEALKGTGPLRALGKGLESGGAALIGGGLGQGIFGQPARQKAAAAATQAFEKATAGREAGIKATEQAHKATGAFNKEMTGALNTMEKDAHIAAKAKFADDSAAKIAADLKKNVPALKAFPENQQGLGDMLYGKGKAAVSRAFDKELKAAAAAGKGKRITMSAEDAKALGVKNMETIKIPSKGRGYEPPTQVKVDAGELAESMTGTWRKNPKAYRVAVDLLEEAGIARGEAAKAYKYYTGQLDYFNSTKAFKGERFNPDAYRAGAVTKDVEKLRRRDIGSLTEGPMELTKGGPLAPTPRQVPVQSPLGPPPPEIPKPDIRTMKNPIAGHPFAMGGAGEALSYGLTGSHGYGVPFVAGMGLSNAMPKELVTKTPGVSPLIESLIQALTKGGGAAGSVLGP